MEPDYPAAHSMDATWFAIDKDGYVARFETGEAGAMPDNALSDQGGVDVMGQLGALLPRTEMILDLHGSLMPGPRDQTPHQQYFPQIGQVKMFLRSRDPLQAEIASGRAREMAASE